MEIEEDPDTAWVAALADTSIPRARRAIEEAQGEHALFRHLAQMHREGGRASYVEIDAPIELYALVRLLRPRHAVEVGVSSGVSSAYLLQAMERLGHGTLHSVDLPKPEAPRPDGSRSRNPSWSLPPGRSSGWAVPIRLRKRWDLRIGNKTDVLPLLGEELETVDLFLYDVPHSDPQAFHEFQSMDRRFHSGSVALVDHGGTEEICPSLARWARTRKSRALRRQGLGLSAFRRP
jgi:Methyltransferase domain